MPSIELPVSPPVPPETQGNGMLCDPTADPVCFWNDQLLRAFYQDSRRLPPSTQEQGGPTRASRAAAIVHAAIHDAVNGVVPVYEPYLVRERMTPPSGTEAAAARAAVGGAAYSTLAWLYPSLAGDFQAALASYFGGAVPFGDPGLAFGTAVGGAYQLARRDDGSGPWRPDDNGPRDPEDDMAAEPPYRQRDAAGEWRSDPLDFDPMGGPQNPVTPGWGAVRPFTIPSGPLFRPAPFPDPTTTPAAYEAAFEDVRQRGDFRSSTPESRADAFFWSYDDGLGTPIRLYNRNVWEVLRTNPAPVVAPATQLHAHARLFALVNLAMADAGIVTWDTKYLYNHWRPVEGIRRADEFDAIYGTTLARDVNWLPVGRPQNASRRANTSPPFPAFTSGHSSFGSALFHTLRLFYDDDDNRSFTLTTEERDVFVNEGMPPTPPAPASATPAIIDPKSFTSFTAASEANGDSRILLGVHWSFDDVRGQGTGRNMAENVAARFLRRLSAS